MSSLSSPHPRPWELLPNPYGFPSLADQVQQVEPLRGSNLAGAPKLPRRSSQVGRDSLGIGFSVGDLVLTSLGGIGRAAEVLEVSLDGTNRKPHLSGTPLLLDQRSQQLFHFEREMTRIGGSSSSSSRFHDRLHLYPVDMGWRGIHLGLIEIDVRSYFYSAQLPANFIGVQLQSFKVKARVLEAGAKPATFRQYQITAYSGLPQDAALIQAYYDALELPRLRDQAFTIDL